MVDRAMNSNKVRSDQEMSSMAQAIAGTMRVREGVSQSSPHEHVIFQLATRIGKLLDEECDALSTATPEVIDRIVARKNELVLESARIVQKTSGNVQDPLVLQVLNSALEKLTRNAEQIMRHIQALEEITSLLGTILSNSNSDGTYTRSAFASGSQR